MQEGRNTETQKRVVIHKSARVASAHAAGAGHTVCEPDRQAETQRQKQGLTFIRVEDTG